QCALRVFEARDKQVIEHGRVYLAPPEYHLLIDEGAIALSTEAPVCHARPSIDVLFESAADAFRERAIGVVLTGASRDGARGAARVQQRGGFIVVQDPTTAESSVLPNAAIAATQADCILPLPEIAPFLVSL